MTKFDDECVLNIDHIILIWDLGIIRWKDGELYMDFNHELGVSLSMIESSFRPNTHTSIEIF